MYMGQAGRISLLFVFLLGLSFAYAGDFGAGETGNVSAPNASTLNASAPPSMNDSIAARCSEPNVTAVYRCIGGVVRVVSSVSGEGSIFYTTGGKAVRCPVVAPGQMGAECMQMMTPNFCPVKAECGSLPAPALFPGQNGTPEQTGDLDYYAANQTGNETLENNTVPSVNATTKPPVKKNITAPAGNELDAPISSKNNLDWPLNYLSFIVLLLGLGSVCLLFMLFRNSLADEEA